MISTFDKAYAEGEPRTGAPRAARRQEIEVLRIVSAFGIVWFHNIAIPGQDIGYAGLVAFIIISMYFATLGSTPPKPVAQRARVLLLPWLVWFIFFGCLNLAKHEPFVPLDHGLVAGVLLGSSVHLWYLPFIWIVIVLFDRVKRPLGERTLAYGSVTLALCLLLSCRLWRGPSLALNYPYAQYMHAAAAVFLGVFFANCKVLARPVQLALVAAVLLTIVWFTLSMRGIGVPYLLGVSAAAVTLLPEWQLPPSFNVSGLSECTLGIYLCHVFWLKLLPKLVPMPQMVLPCVVFVASALSVWAFRKTLPRLARYIV
ncbi:acyltransferase family protein [Duganella sp. Dugasp56]|uniref:acyltransferase family protein n=1 Tax=Duganella sp. Dugasp56 TaxID=3243046 RepID=UPI0039B0844A